MIPFLQISLGMDATIDATLTKGGLVGSLRLTVQTNSVSTPIIQRSFEF